MDNSRAIIQECLGGLACYRTLCLTTYSPSLKNSGWKLFDLESGNPNFGQSKAHNSGVPGGTWLVKELVEILCPTTYSLSLIKIGWKLWLRERKPYGRRPPACPPAHRMCSHNTSRFSNRRIKNGFVKKVWPANERVK